jgi:16S rRNA (guanine527-N7)-methyltransferase|tara:strand:- start:42 stop:659 length:618 start_codon:yes stop_codon:yes gene_type:complete
MNKEDVKLNLKEVLNFSPEQLEKIQIFHDELLIFNKKYNLISKSTENDVWNRHIRDSAQLVKYINFDEDKSLSDMGTGAGFPGVILAIFNKNPNFHVKLYEKSNIKCDFLDTVRNKLNVDYDIYGNYKDESITSEYVVSRAFKKLEEIIRISREKIISSHRLIILKGKNAENEISKLHNLHNLVYKTENSITDTNSKILIIEIKK